MRNFEIVTSRVSPLRLVTALLLAGAASGCSSDATRFDGLFASRTDTLTTASVPHRTNSVNGKVPIPRANVKRGNQEDLTGDAALNQPFPETAQYDPVNTSTTDMSSARVSAGRVERRDLSTPTARSEEKVALAQPLPAKKVMTLEKEVQADPIRTGTVRGTWRVTDDSQRILIKSGDTLSGIAARYKVPQAEILKANGLQSGADLKYGRSIIIPSKVTTEQKKEKTLETAEKKKMPEPEKKPEQDKAILANNSRDSKKGSTEKLAANDKAKDASKDGAAAKGNFYVVKQGDSLARIAREHKVSVDDIKAANGMNTASLQIGQKLTIPAADTMKTASIPSDTGKVKETVEAKPKTYTPPVAEKSVEEVQKTADTGQEAPEDTGIGKFRWPVRGAVIAGYGQNVDGVRNTGIDISVPEGTPIKAAENGVVIYAGSGLKDLGNTVLVRHDDGTVTVYGNASQLNVKRGDKVTRGQVIANSGMSGGAKRPKVHFEVRKNAVAVNPMTFLQ
jgi:murein DD-endopeptidase MepM/ murein hydrolase activator NlpD